MTSWPRPGQEKIVSVKMAPEKELQAEADHGHDGREGVAQAVARSLAAPKGLWPGRCERGLGPGCRAAGAGHAHDDGQGHDAQGEGWKDQVEKRVGQGSPVDCKQAREQVRRWTAPRCRCSAGQRGAANPAGSRRGGPGAGPARTGASIRRPAMPRGSRSTPVPAAGAPGCRGGCPAGKRWPWPPGPVRS